MFDKSHWKKNQILGYEDSDNWKLPVLINYGNFIMYWILKKTWVRLRLLPNKVKPVSRQLKYSSYKMKIGEKFVGYETFDKSSMTKVFETIVTYDIEVLNAVAYRAC